MQRRLVLLLAVSTSVHAQLVAPHRLQGTVASTNGVPVAGANVFLLETLDGALTDTAGRFVIRTRAHGPATLLVRHLAFKPYDRLISADSTGSIDIVVTPNAARLSAVTVQAGAYRADDKAGAALTSLDVARTPGATADVARAVQTLPGVQMVDEGTGLFVRGGDVGETRVFLNGAAMLSPYNYETPTGNFTATVNPFLLDGIVFSSGAFGVRYGNALSGIADLHTQGRPQRASLTGVAGLASVSVGAALPVAPGLGVHATAARNDLQYLLRVNGSRRTYTPAPTGDDASASVVWTYRPSAEVKTFAINGRDRFGVAVSDPSYDDTYSANVRSTMIVTGWRDVFGTLAPSLTISYARAHRDEVFGVFDIESGERWSQLVTETAWTANARHTVRAGADADWRDARFIGSLPLSSSDRRPGARFTAFDSRAAGNRAGLFVESDLRPADAWRVIAGVRSDYSSFTRVRTVDPRLSTALALGSGVTLTAAWGDYSQVPDPLYFADGLGRDRLAPMHARQTVFGTQVGGELHLLRVEAYSKRYDELAGLTRDKAVTPGGTGFARGVDVFLKATRGRLSGRVTYSYVEAERTDPNTGVQAPAWFEVPHSATIIVDENLPNGWTASGALRYATGKPFTPVSASTLDAARGVWVPRYGAPNSERLPALERVDLSVSRAFAVTPTFFAVLFGSVNNLTNRENVYEYRYNTDYSHRVPVPSLFDRSVYVGASLTHTARAR